jgi:hypothetical protein
MFQLIIETPPEAELLTIFYEIIFSFEKNSVKRELFSFLLLVIGQFVYYSKVSFLIIRRYLLPLTLTHSA